MKIFKNVEILWHKNKKLALISWKNNKKTVHINSFRYSKAIGSKHVGFKFIVDLFGDYGHCHWIELTILDWIVSLRIDTKSGRKKLERFEKEHDRKMRTLDKKRSVLV